MLAHWLSLGAAERLAVAAYLAVLAALALQGAYRYALAHRARGYLPPLPPAGPADSFLPVVTVQLPIYNERPVVERLLRAVAALDWPADRLEIQVLDDSTDATSAAVAGEVGRMRALGIDVHHLRRPARSGYKAGALAHGLDHARGEIVAIFDADFVPPADLLRRLVPHFADPAVGLVQARWEHLNRDESLLTRVQAVLLDGHFLIEQAARAGAGHFFNFNGTAGLWRRTAIEQAGGWQSDTLTEDLDLSYRAQLAGWRFIYRPDVVVPAELPADIHAFKGQQQRWARGAAQSAVKLLPAVLGARLPLATRCEALLHLTANLSYPLLLALALLAWPAMALRYRGGWSQALGLELPFFLFATGSVAAFYARPLARAASGAGRLGLLAALMAVGIGMSVGNSRAVLSGLLDRGGEFHRTPKTGSRGAGAPAAYRARAVGTAALELGLGVWFVALLLPALRAGLIASLPFLALFATGFLAIGWRSLRRPDRSASPA